MASIKTLLKTVIKQKCCSIRTGFMHVWLKTRIVHIFMTGMHETNSGQVHPTRTLRVLLLTTCKTYTNVYSIRTYYIRISLLLWEDLTQDINLVSKGVFVYVCTRTYMDLPKNHTIQLNIPTLVFESKIGCMMTNGVSRIGWLMHLGQY